MRRIALVAAMLLSATSASAAANLDLDGGARRTAKAVRVAATEAALDGTVWLGKMRGVGGGRDTLLYVPSTIDAKRTIDVVIYM